jgi:hypothetical protein
VHHRHRIGREAATEMFHTSRMQLDRHDPGTGRHQVLVIAP